MTTLSEKGTLERNDNDPIKLAFADTIEQQVQKAQQRVDKLTQSILAKAFRGELVPQDNP